MMKKYITIVLFSITSLSTYGQIDVLMKGYDNKYALEHIELFYIEPEEDLNISDLPYHQLLEVFFKSERTFEVGCAVRMSPDFVPTNTSRQNKSKATSIQKGVAFAF